MRTSNIIKRRRKRTDAPGVLKHPEGALPSKLYFFSFDADHIEEKAVSSVEEIRPYLRRRAMLWVNVDGLGSPEVMRALGEMFDLHPLALEDVMHVPQRPKVDDYEDNIYAVVRMVNEPQAGDPSFEQLSMFWGRGFILTIQEEPGDVFEGVRERLRRGGRRVRMSQPDYMAYALLDALVDSYFPFLEKLGSQLDDLEESVLIRPSQEAMKRIYKIKRTLNAMRLCVWPLRDAVSKLNKETGLIQPETLVFMRDCLDHVAQVIDIMENYRERVSSLTDLYLSSLSNKLNEVMKVLTIFATIFMPLQFLTGIYGMNFDPHLAGNMPELELPYAYPVLLAVMGIVTGGMIYYFFRRGWLWQKNGFELSDDE